MIQRVKHTSLQRSARIDSADAAESIRRRASDLFQQQCWCWGRDVLRPEGNWLREIGFSQIKPPPERTDCSSSVYQLSLAGGRCVVLRGFGAFYGEHSLGGIFISRNTFAPRYLRQAMLDSPPWSDTDLPPSPVSTIDNRQRSVRLTLGMIEWIAQYETDVASRLGLAYREATLIAWNNRKHAIIPACQFASAWHALAERFADHHQLSAWKPR
ncbi:hypothetical protein [Bremerella cremea]|uniref:hypothetical protein n=1 Tax=Bremerella cremea TaxID=1031537 RepID=UPI0031E64AC8